VPEGIVAFLGLVEGDQLDWRMEVDEKHERYIVLRRFKAVNEEVMKIASKHATVRRK
jgi:hypothetical protein